MANEFYAISATAAALTALTETNLLVEPHPSEFIYGELVGIAGDGSPIEHGDAESVWTYGAHLSASQWKELMDFVGAAAYADVYIRTRTNAMDADGTYEYKNYSCKMWRPEGTSIPPYRFTGVSIRFTKLEEI